MSDTPVIQLDRVTVVYNQGTPNEVAALSNVSFIASRGERLLIAGGNGSGKSTLLKAIAGTAPVRSGRIYLRGKDITRWSPHRRAAQMGFVHQDPMLGLCPALTLHENMQLSTGRAWFEPIFSPLRMDNGHLRLLAQTGLPLDEKANAAVSTLSGGQRQALAICLAFMAQRSILLLDEYMASLDESAKEQVASFVASESNRRDLTTMSVVHDAARGLFTGYRILRLKAGMLEPSSP